MRLGVSTLPIDHITEISSGWSQNSEVANACFVTVSRSSPLHLGALTHIHPLLAVVSKLLGHALLSTTTETQDISNLCICTYKLHMYYCTVCIKVIPPNLYLRWTKKGLICSFCAGLFWILHGMWIPTSEPTALRMQWLVFSQTQPPPCVNWNLFSRKDLLSAIIIFCAQGLIIILMLPVGFAFQVYT